MLVRISPSPYRGWRGGWQWPCGTHGTAGTAWSGGGAQRAGGSSPTAPQQWPPASSCVRRSLSSRTRFAGSGRGCSRHQGSLALV